MTDLYAQRLLGLPVQAGAQYLLGWTTVLLFGVGVYLLSRQALALILDLSTGLIGYIRRQLQPRMMRRLLTAIQDEPIQQRGERVTTRLLLYSLSRLRVVWIAVGVLAALSLSDAMLSPVALTAILVGGELYRAQLYHQRMGRLNEDVGNLVVQFQSRYPLNRSLVKTLQEAANVLPSGETRSAVESTLARLRMNMAIVEAVKPLQSLPHPVMRQLAGMIAEVQDTNQDVFLETLRLLQEEVESKLDLRQQARQSLTLVRGTTALTQAEMSAAMAKAVRQGWVEETEISAAWQDFSSHWPSYTRLPVSDGIVERAASLAWRRGLRAYDSVHLASALTWQGVTGEDVVFACFDKQLLQAARHEGLQTWTKDTR